MLSYEHMLRNIMKQHHWYIDMVVRSKMMDKLGGQEASDGELAALLINRHYPDGTQSITLRATGEELIVIQPPDFANGHCQFLRYHV